MLGSNFNDTLTANAFNNSLNGGTGGDSLTGGDGNDTYVIDNLGDVISETSNVATQIDTVQSTLSNYTLVANVENLTLLGTAAINGTGNTLNNTLVGNGANNIFDGGAGIDTLIGGDGNDTYIIDSTTDTITETATGGIDTVQSAVNYTLAASSNLENLLLTGTIALNGNGNSLNNKITGNSGANILNGGAGIDTLTGGDGNDVLVGGFGNDTLIGSAGNDRFTFNSFNEGIDTIADFNKTVDDIYVSAAGFKGGLANNTAIADSQFLSGLGVTAAANSNQRFIYNTSNGALFFDVDGNATGSAAIQIATLTNAPTFASTDIFVIA